VLFASTLCKQALASCAAALEAMLQSDQFLGMCRGQQG